MNLSDSIVHFFADELIGGKAFEGLQPSPKGVGADEVGEVISQLVVVDGNRPVFNGVHS